MSMCVLTQFVYVMSFLMIDVLLIIGFVLFSFRFPCCLFYLFLCQKCCWQRELAELKARHEELVNERHEMKRQLDTFEREREHGMMNGNINNINNSSNNNNNINDSSNINIKKEEITKLRHDLAKWQEAYKYRNERYEHYKKAWAEEKERCISLLQEHNEAKNESREWELKYEQLRSENVLQRNERQEHSNNNGHSHSIIANGNNTENIENMENSEIRKRLREYQRQNDKV